MECQIHADFILGIFIRKIKRFGKFAVNLCPKQEFWWIVISPHAQLCCLWSKSKDNLLCIFFEKFCLVFLFEINAIMFIYRHFMENRYCHLFPELLIISETDLHEHYYILCISFCCLMNFIARGNAFSLVVLRGRNKCKTENEYISYNFIWMTYTVGILSKSWYIMMNIFTDVF